jgi:hypothetical protein
VSDAAAPIWRSLRLCMWMAECARSVASFAAAAVEARD